MTDEIVCTCASGNLDPRKCKLHPEIYRLQIAELNLESHLESRDAQAAMAELNRATIAALKKRTAEIESLQRVVFETTPTKNFGLRRFLRERKRTPGRGGATDYEVWLRSLDHSDLSQLCRLYTSAIDGLRYRRRFVQHEEERRFLHSSYGKHAVEDLFDLTEAP